MGIDKNEKEEIIKELKKEHKECAKCPHLQIINKDKVKCFYFIKDRCVLK